MCRRGVRDYLSVSVWEEGAVVSLWGSAADRRSAYLLDCRLVCMKVLSDSTLRRDYNGSFMWLVMDERFPS